MASWARATGPSAPEPDVDTRAALPPPAQVMVANVTAFLTAGRFGLAPATNRPADAGLKLSEVDSGLMTGDPAGFTAVDVLAFGSMGHVVGIGMVLGLKATGQL